MTNVIGWGRRNFFDGVDMMEGRDGKVLRMVHLYQLRLERLLKRSKLLGADEQLVLSHVITSIPHEPEFVAANGSLSVPPLDFFTAQALVAAGCQRRWVKGLRRILANACELQDLGTREVTYLGTMHQFLSQYSTRQKLLKIRGMGDLRADVIVACLKARSIPFPYRISRRV